MKSPRFVLLVTSALAVATLAQDKHRPREAESPRIFEEGSSVVAHKQYTGAYLKAE